jgi:hypothetical protein
MLPLNAADIVVKKDFNRLFNSIYNSAVDNTNITFIEHMTISGYKYFYRSIIRSAFNPRYLTTHDIIFVINNSKKYPELFDIIFSDDNKSDVLPLLLTIAHSKKVSSERIFNNASKDTVYNIITYCIEENFIDELINILSFYAENLADILHVVAVTRQEYEDGAYREVSYSLLKWLMRKGQSNTQRLIGSSSPEGYLRARCYQKPNYIAAAKAIADEINKLSASALLANFNDVASINKFLEVLKEEAIITDFLFLPTLETNLNEELL